MVPSAGENQLVQVVPSAGENQLVQVVPSAGENQLVLSWILLLLDYGCSRVETVLVFNPALFQEE